MIFAPRNRLPNERCAERYSSREGCALSQIDSTWWIGCWAADGSPSAFMGRCAVGHPATGTKAMIKVVYSSIRNIQMWATGTIYRRFAVVQNGGIVFFCVKPHTSGHWPTDLI